MAISSAEMLELVRELVAIEIAARDVAADRVTDWIDAFTDDQVATVAQLLMWLATIERDEVAREAQLHALAELAEHDRVPLGVLAQVGLFSDTNLRGSSLEHYEYLGSLDLDRAPSAKQTDQPPPDSSRISGNR